RRHTHPAATRTAGCAQIVGAVFWSFFGIRRKAAGERDMVTIKPFHVIIAGLLGAAIFVFVLIVLVSVITNTAYREGAWPRSSRRCGSRCWLRLRRSHAAPPRLRSTKARRTAST